MSQCFIACFILLVIAPLQTYMDKTERRATHERSTPSRMTHYIEDMLIDLKKAHRVREDQLSSAANTYRQRLEKVVNQHEHLLIAYRYVLALSVFLICI